MFRRIARTCFVIAFVFLFSYAKADEPAVSAAESPPKEVWSVSTGLESPESAYYDPVSKFIFVSNVASNDAAAKNGKGFISKLDTSGKVLSAEWVSGLNAPKGIRSYKDTLWVSGVDELVGISISTGQVRQHIKIDGAKFLNDIAIDNDGNLYVSDTVGGKIYKVTNGDPTVFASGDELEHPHGVLVHDELLIVASIGADEKEPSGPKAGHLFSLNLASKKKDLLAQDLSGHLSGVELDGSGGYYVSDFAAGKVYRVSSDGAATLLVDGLKGAADICVIEGQQLLLVPRMLENKLTAYKLSDQ